MREKRAGWEAWYITIILAMVNCLNYGDRMLLSVLAEPIKADLRLSDSQLGLLSGFAFVFLYAVSGIPLARLADRTTRKFVVAGALAVWSFMTSLCGLSQGFWQLALARVGVGAGEAGCMPPSLSLISDYFPKERRFLPTAVFSIGAGLGVLLGSIVATAIAAEIGWRWAFLFMGVPGIIVAAVVALTVREPVRGETEGLADASAATTSWVATFREIFQQPGFALLTSGLAFATLATYGFSQWLPVYLLRYHHLSLQDAGAAFGIVSMVGSILGTLGGGAIAHYLAKRSLQLPLLAAMVGIGLLVPFQLVAVWAPDLKVCLMASLLANLAMMTAAAPVLGYAQNIGKPHLRATSIALLLLASSMIGVGGGPFVVGFLSDALAGFTDQSLRYGLTVVTFSAGFSAICLLLAYARARPASLIERIEPAGN